MSKEIELVKYFSENAIVLTRENIKETIEAYEPVNKFEDFIISHPDMHTTKRILGKISTACDSATEADQKKKFLLDYTSFLRFLMDFYKGGIQKQDDGKVKVNSDWFVKPNLQSCFKSQELLGRYSDDAEQDELCCEPILLFDDEDCVNEVISFGGFPIVVMANQVDTQIMNEQMEGTYNLTPMFPVLNGIFNTARLLGTPELSQVVATLRSKVIQMNGKPISVKDKMLGRLTPPEGFVIIRLAERLTNLRNQGARIIASVQQAETEDQQITPEEFEEIQNYIVNVLKQPIKRATPAVMGPLMSREVIRLENQVYHLSPNDLASDFLQAIETHANQLHDDPNRYYTAAKQMFNALQSASSTKAAADTAMAQDSATDPHHAGSYMKPKKVGNKAALNLATQQNKNAAKQGLTSIISMIDTGKSVPEIMAALNDYQKRFV